MGEGGVVLYRGVSGVERRSCLPSRVAACAVLCVAAVVLVALLAQRAYAGAPPTMSFSGSTVTCQYSNNVAAGRVFSGNASAWAVGPDGATVNLAVWRNYYGDGSPDAANPDTYGERRRLYIDTSPLLPGTTYTVTKGAAVSLGGDSYPAASITITTPGTPPAPVEPEPEPEPDPVEPPPDGDGGSQGNGGSDSAGDGADQSSPGDASDDPSDGASGEESGGEDAEPSPSSSPSLTSSDERRTENVPSADAAASGSNVASSEPVAAGESRAAGIGGGAVYLVGQAGLDPGEQKDEVEEPSVATLTMLALVCAGVVAAGLGAAKRIIAWKRHLTRGSLS